MSLAETRPAPRSITDAARRGLLPGLVAGAAYLSVAMVTGAVTVTAWAMPDGIARTVGVDAPGRYGFAVLPLLVGIAGHLAVSVALGALFAVIACRLRSRGRIVVAALVFAGVEPAFAIWVVLHSVLPYDTFQIFLTAIPLWASILGHLTYGTVLTVMIIANSAAVAGRGSS